MKTFKQIEVAPEGLESVAFLNGLTASRVMLQGGPNLNVYLSVTNPDNHVLNFLVRRIKLKDGRLGHVLKVRPSDSTQRGFEDLGYVTASGLHISLTSRFSKDSPEFTTALWMIDAILFQRGSLPGYIIEQVKQDEP